MPALQHDIKGRVQRLPEPHSWRAALIPIFEAAMNGIQSLQEAGRAGTVRVEIAGVDGADWEVCISDDGLGLTAENWEAFGKLDTTHKIAIGGKGVGRLMWLAAFYEVTVSSVYADDAGCLRKRSFDFRLDNSDTISNLEDIPCKDAGAHTGFEVRLRRPRGAYWRHFEKISGREIVEAFLGHFLPALSLNNKVQLIVSVDGKIHNIGDRIKKMIVRREPAEIIDPERGRFQLLLLECKETVAAGEKRNNYVIAAAHGRAVAQQPIDNLIGVSHIGKSGDEKTVLLAVLEGQYLDDHVNQERTGFTFETDKNLADLIKSVCLPKIKAFAREAIAEAQKNQRARLTDVIAEYPSLSIEPIDALQKRLLPSDKKEEEIYARLSWHKFRADRSRKDAIDKVLKASRHGKDVLVPESLPKQLKEVLGKVGEADRNQLAEYVTRRRVLLDLLEALTEIGDAGSFALEDALHTLIIETKVTTLGERPTPVSHDLWMLDENLAFAGFVSSDLELRRTVECGDKGMEHKRPDIAIFDRVVAFGEGDVPSRIYIIEFKRPMREKYEKPVMRQIEDYIAGLKNGKIKGPDGRMIHVPEACIFQCHVVADIVGDLKEEVKFWTPTEDGFGRVHRYGSGQAISGFIEVIPWDRLISRARQRNRAFFEQAGLPG